MGVTTDRIIGVVLLLIGMSMLLIAADLIFLAEVEWTVLAVVEVSLLAAVGVAAIIFGFKRMLAGAHPH